MMKRALKLGALVMGMALMLCACGSSSESGESVSETDGSVSETDSNDSEETTTLYAYNYDVESLVTLGEYKGLTYTEIDTSVTDDEVEAEIEDILASYATVEEITDRAVEDGDTVNIDYEGTMDGEAFDGGTASGASLTIGSDSYIDGFEDGLIGAEVGTEVVLELTFPETYGNTDLAGQDVTFTVTVNYIEGDSIVPDFDDAFVQDLGIDEITTVDEYREYVREYLTVDKESEAESTIQSELFSQAVENAVINEYPEDLVAQYQQEYIDYYTTYATYFGMELEEFLSTYMSLTEEELEADAQIYGEEVTANMLVVCAIAKAEGYEVTDEVYEEKLAEYAGEYGYSDAETMESDYGREYLTQVMINEAVIQIIQENAVAGEAVEETEEIAETEVAG